MGSASVAACKLLLSNCFYYSPRQIPNSFIPPLAVTLQDDWHSAIQQSMASSNNNLDYDAAIEKAKNESLNPIQTPVHLKGVDLSYLTSGLDRKPAARYSTDMQPSTPTADPEEAHKLEVAEMLERALSRSFDDTGAGEEVFNVDTGEVE